MNEVWKSVPGAGFSGYKISNLGRFMSTRKSGATGEWKFITPHLNLSGTKNNEYLSIDFVCSIRKKRFTFFVHRLLYGVFIGPIPEGYCVDHKDGNKINNSFDNLRLATKIENCRNSVPRRGRKYKGVYLHRGRWEVALHVDGKQKHIGNFDTELEGVRAYNTAALQYYGEFARLNVISEEMN